MELRTLLPYNRLIVPKWAEISLWLKRITQPTRALHNYSPRDASALFLPFNTRGKEEQRQLNTRFQHPMSAERLGTCIPEEWALSLTDVFAHYMVARFNASVSSDGNPRYLSIPDPRLTVPAICEADRMVRILVGAYRNKGEVAEFTCCTYVILTLLLVVIDNIDIIRLGEKFNGHNSQTLKGKTPEEIDGDLESAYEELEQLTKPSVVTDRSGYILLLYLPGLVSNPNQVSDINLDGMKTNSEQEIYLESIVPVGGTAAPKHIDCRRRKLESFRWFLQTRVRTSGSHQPIPCMVSARPECQYHK